MNTGCLNTPIKSRGVLFLFLIFRFVFLSRVFVRVSNLSRIAMNCKFVVQLCSDQIRE